METAKQVRAEVKKNASEHRGEVKEFIDAVEAAGQKSLDEDTKLKGRSMDLSKKDKIGIGLIALCALVVISAIAATFIIQRNRASRPKPDPVTLCPYEQSYAHTVILIDWTDPLSDTQKAVLRSKIHQI